MIVVLDDVDGFELGADCGLALKVVKVVLVLLLNGVAVVVIHRCWLLFATRRILILDDGGEHGRGGRYSCRCARVTAAESRYSASGRPLIRRK